jgi:4,5-DOPA dioxygenase extradiol
MWVVLLNTEIMERKQFLKFLALAPLTSAAMKLNDLKNITDSFTTSAKMPVLFIGHGHPMNAILDNNFTQSLTKLGKSIEKPNAVLVISAHWETVGTYVSTNPFPRTIYDFGNFDKKLFDIKYEPKGHPELAKELIKTVETVKIKEDNSMGLDHGAWTVLKFIFPKADVPVFEMSMDYSKGAEFHYSLGKELAKLRKKGVMIICSGNIVHNLNILDWNNIDAKPFDWNVEFDNLVKKNIDNRTFNSLVNFQNLGKAAKLSIPTTDHYYPMLYSLGMVQKDEPIKHIYEGYQYGGISMRCFKIG